MSRLQKKPPAHKRGHPTLQNMNFSYFCGSFLPAWIRIRIRIQITDPDPMVRLNTDPIRIRIRIRNRNPGGEGQYVTGKNTDTFFQEWILFVLVEVSPSRRLGACWRHCCWMRTAFSSRGPSQLFFGSSMLCSVSSWVVFHPIFFPLHSTISTRSSAIF
jgi:hypothetical protein